ncbi:MAG: DUF1508 domain-containing protein [Patescibacteria group bacterium]
MAGKNKIVIKSSQNKQKYAIVKSANNKTIAVTETYKTKQGVNNAAKALKKIIKDAVVIDETK